MSMPYPNGTIGYRLYVRCVWGLWLIGVLWLSGAGCNPSPPHKSDAHPRTQAMPEAQPKPHKDGDPETLPSGWIRRINWEQRQIMYESEDGYIRILGPICGKQPDMLPVWEGMAVSQINFRWIVSEAAGECYALDWVGHDPSRDTHLMNVPVNASGVSKP